MNWYAVFFLCAAGFFLACMDARQWAQDGFRRVFGWLGENFLFTKGKRYFGFWLNDSWHVSKNLLLACVGLSLYCASGNPLYLLSGIVIGVSFAIFYHILFGAKL